MASHIYTVNQSGFCMGGPFLVVVMMVMLMIVMPMMMIVLSFTIPAFSSRKESPGELGE